MGRELRRKEAKKNKNKNIKVNEEIDTEIHRSTIIKILVIGLLIIVALYYIVAIFITKEINISFGSDKDKTTENSNTNQVTDRILAKNAFNQAENDYYVYFYDFKDEDASLSGAIKGHDDLKVYRVDTGSGLNQNYVVTDKGNRNVSSINDLKVKNPTVIKISADKVTAYYEGSKEILDFFG